MSGQPKYRVEIFWSEEDGGYIANIPELKYTSAFGETREEALREVLVAEELHLETLEELGRHIPEPSSGNPTQRVIGPGAVAEGLVDSGRLLGSSEDLVIASDPHVFAEGVFAGFFDSFARIAEEGETVHGPRIVEDDSAIKLLYP